MTKKATTQKKSRSKKDASVENYQEYDLIDNQWTAPKEEEAVNMDDYKIRRMGPFDILDMMFKEPARFDSLPDDQLEQFGFLLNRRFAIKYPMQAAQFSKMGASQAWTLRAWALYLRRIERGGGVPRFLYTSSKKEDKQKVGIDAFDEETINDYLKRYELSRSDFKDMLQFFNEDTVAHVERFFKMNSKSEQKKMFKEK